MGSIDIILEIKNKMNNFFFYFKEREHMSGRKVKGRRRERNPSRLPLSGEPHTGLDPLTQQITTGTEAKS